MSSANGDCEKCGRPPFREIMDDSRLLEPWCRECAQEYRTEYAPVRRAWVHENAEQVLEDMGVPSKYVACSFKGFEIETAPQQKARHGVMEWLTGSFEPPWLFLCGPCGTGKTHLAVSALLGMRARGRSGRFVSVLELLSKLRNSFRDGGAGPEGAIEKCCRARVLLLDDLGAERPTEFSRETLSLIVDTIYRDESSLIVTSNFEFQGLAERIDARTADRLIEMCKAVRLSGPSYRQKLAVKRANLASSQKPEAVQ